MKTELIFTDEEIDRFAEKIASRLSGTEIKIASKIINVLERNLECAEYDKLQNGDRDIDAFCDGFKDAIKCIKEYYKMI